MSKDARDINEMKWEEATNKVIAEKLVDSVKQLLNGKVTHYVCSDKTTTHQKIVIEYNHKQK